MSKDFKITAIILMFLGVLAIELWTPRGYAEWVLYFIPFIIASRLVTRLYIHLLSVLIILLIVAGFFISPAGHSAAALTNRFFGILAIVLITYVTSQRMRAENEIRHLAHHDPLTGLPNRRLFMDIAEIDLARALRNGKRAGILYLDLDHFKEVNDTFGHGAGDQLLKEVAARLKSLLRKADSVARVGGDEFNILLSEINAAADAVAVAGEIVAALGRPYGIDGHELRVTSSVGITIYPDDGRELEGLLKSADSAMYEAKKLGKNTFRLYNP